MISIKPSRSSSKLSLLKNWKEYKIFYRSLGKDNQLKVIDKFLNPFEARFNLASKFSGIEAGDIAKNTLRGYVAAMKLMLAYSSAEMLCKARNKKVTDWIIENKDLANNLRRILKPYNHSSKRKPTKLKDISFILTSKEANQRFLAFMNKENNDVRIIATVFRIAVAHGSFNPNAFDIYSASNATILNRLTKALLRKCQSEFNAWFKEEKMKIKSLN